MARVLCMTLCMNFQRFTFMHIVRKIINIKLTVLHTLMLILTELHFSIKQVITTGSCLEIGVLWPHSLTQTPDQLQCSSRARPHNEMNFGQLKGRIQWHLIKDKTNLLSSLSFISIVLYKEKPVIQSLFACNKRYYARSAIVLYVK